MSSPRTILLRASPDCLAMICRSYGASTYGSTPDYFVGKLQEEGIALERAVKQHQQLLDLDWSMRETESALSAEVQKLATQWEFDETNALLRGLAHSNARLRRYGSYACDLCPARHTRYDIRVVRVWPKSLTLSLCVQGHAPRRVRLKPVGFGFQDDSGNACLTFDHINGMADRLREVRMALRGALDIPPDLQDYVIAYAGPHMITMDYRVMLESD